MLFALWSASAFVSLGLVIALDLKRPRCATILWGGLTPGDRPCLRDTVEKLHCLGQLCDPPAFPAKMTGEINGERGM